MSVTVVIVNYRTPDLTLRAVEATHRETKAIAVTRIQVIDNSPGDGFSQILEKAIREHGWENVSISASPHNGGFAYGVNRAVRPALRDPDPPDYFYLLNSDAVPQPGSIEALVGFLDENPEIGIAGSFIYGREGTHVTAFRFPSAIGEFETVLALGVASRLLDRWIVAKPVPVTPARVDWLAGVSMMVRRRVFEDVGLLDENFFMYFEETDFCKRARDSGWSTWYLPASRVEHVGGASTGFKDLSKPRPVFWFESRRYYFKKNHGRLYLWMTNAMWILGYLLWRPRAVLQGKPYPYPRRFFRDFIRHNLSLWRPIASYPKGELVSETPT